VTNGDTTDAPAIGPTWTDSSPHVGPPVTARQVEQPLDGRVARRERNRDAVLDVVLEMFTEELLWPSIELASTRSGISLRSVYRYFPDPAALIEAAIRRNVEKNREFALLPAIGRGPLGTRIDEFVAMRVRLHERIGPVFRATIHNAPSHERVRDELAEARRLFREQFERQFAPEVDGLGTARRQDVVAAGDVLTQIDAVDLLRRYRRFTISETEAALRSGLSALLERP
jgi:TetR/AcrR family transcriptional regulator of autoinduction and epiphytic fitness